MNFELAQEEIAAKAGYFMDNEDQTMEVALLNKDLMEVLPGVEEANAISDELERNTRFEVMLVAPQILGKSSDRTEVMASLFMIFPVLLSSTHTSCLPDFRVILFRYH